MAKLSIGRDDNLAHVAIKKSLLKEYHSNQDDRIVYLNDGDEFQISIFNPYDYVIGVALSFNSNNVDKSKLLVIKPGERVWLDRYLSENRKLLFSTYEVDDSKEAKKAIAKNGLLNVYFYKEQENYYDIVKIYNYNDHDWLDDSKITWTANNLTSAYTNSVANFNSSISNTSVSNANYSSYSSACTLPLDTCLTASSTIETGRIEKGNYSNQKFTNYQGDFNNWAFKTETIKLLPMSQKQVNVNDLEKIYCYNCGRKLKSKFKYCPYCGSKL